MGKKILLIAICCCLCVPVLAAETLETLTERVSEMEKANYVQHEDLLRARIEIDVMMSDLGDRLTEMQKTTLVELSKKIEVLDKDWQKQFVTLSDGLKQLKRDTDKQKDDLHKEIIDTNRSTENRMATQSKKMSEMENSINDLYEKMRHFHPGSGTSAMEPISVVSSKPLSLANQPKVELFRLSIENSANGNISVSRDKGASWQKIGHVVAPDVTVRTEADLPPKWSQPGIVASTTLNSIAIRTAYDAKQRIGKSFYLLPAPAPGVSAVAVDVKAAGIQTDIQAGKEIFGDQTTPFQGNEVFLEAHGALKPIYTPADAAGGPSNEYTPANGDKLIIVAEQLTNMPAYYTFENFYGGFVKAIDWNGASRTIGEVLVPVLGIGHFDQVAASESGRLSSAYNGMMDISVLNTKEFEGFRIMLCTQDNQNAVTKARFQHNCMVVSEFYASDPTWQGLAPLFMGYLNPCFNPSDANVSSITSRVYVEFKSENENGQKSHWGIFPPIDQGTDNKVILKNADTAMERITDIRIDCPVQHLVTACR